MNILSTFKRVVAMSAMFGFVTAGLATADINIPAGVGLDNNLYFQTPGGDPVQVKAGLYEVDKAEDWLKLTPVGGERYDSVLIDAKAATHDDEDLTTARAFLMPASEENPDLQNLLFYTTAGIAYEAAGSKSGVFTRGLGSWVKKKARGAYNKTKRAAKGVGRAAKKVGKGVGRVAKGAVKGAGRVAKGAGRVAKGAVKTGIRAGRIGMKIGLYAPKKVLQTAGKVGRQVYQGGKLLHKIAKGLIALPKTAIEKAVGQACATVIPETRKACERAVRAALNGVQIPKLP